MGELKKYYFLSILLIFPAWVISQSLNPRFERLALGGDNGLSQATVRTILQDTMGFMWFGTADGLNRYDGKTFTAFRHQADVPYVLSSNDVRVLYEDIRGDLWIGTDYGLNRFDRVHNDFKNYLHTSNEPGSIGNNFVGDIISDAKGRMWVGDGAGVLNLYLAEQDKFQRYVEPDHPSNINELHLANDGTIWIAFEDQSFFNFNPATGEFKQILARTEKEVISIYQDAADRLWLGLDDGGLLVYDVKDGEKQRLQHDNQNLNSLSNNVIWDIQEDQSGRLLLATDQGINFIHPEELKAEESIFGKYQNDPYNDYSLASNFIIDLFVAKNGIIWVGTNDAGVSKLDPTFQLFTHYAVRNSQADLLSHNVVWSICETDDKIIWVGTSNGLNRINRATSEVEQYFHHPDKANSVAHDRIWSIVQEDQNTFWLGTSGGMDKMTIGSDGTPSFQNWQYDPEDPSSISANSVRFILKDQLGNIWVGTNLGFNLFDAATGKFKRYEAEASKPGSISSNYVRSIYQGPDNRLWICTIDGLNQYLYDKDEFISYHHDPADSTSLSNDIIRCVYQDRKGRLWVGTSSGLNRGIEDESTGLLYFEHFSERDGLPNDIIYGIEEDKAGNLWISTNRGLSCFNPEERSFRNYDFDNGLQGDEFNQNAQFKNAAGEFFFGGINGFNIFKPEEILLSGEHNLVFEDFLINYRPVNIRDQRHLDQHISLASSVTLHPTDRLFLFKFSTLNYNRILKYTYRFRLENFDNDWNEVGQQDVATYTNIPHGKYTFRVQARLGDQAWEERETSMRVVIKPAFWQTWWFRVLIFLLVLGIVWAIYQNSVGNLKRNKRLLEATVKERTEDIQYQKDQLEKTVQELKATQAQLVQSEKMASLGQLTAGIAHEINNPVNFIASNVEALKLDFADLQTLLDHIDDLPNCVNPEICLEEINQLSKNLDVTLLKNEIADLIGGVERGAQRTKDIVSGLRTFSRDNKDKFELANIHEGLDSTLIILGNKLKDKIRIKKDYGEIPEIYCQISKLNQVFLNIINNAIQAINQDEGLITIATKVVDETVHISITDTGPGMDEITKKRIFEPFYTTKEVGKGTGLGLSISYGIVEHHHGKIQVESTIGKGATFTLTLPIAPT